ncbi:MAG: hypothetical protein M3P49_02365 [Actinomycetota bacterium]|nr:hypothetical protein [Actinomycetota bacterium]
MHPTQSVDAYETTDLSLAGAILAAGHKLSHVERRAGRGWFVFEPDPRIGATVAAFYGGSLRVDARTLTDHLRALKQALYVPAGAL